MINAGGESALCAIALCVVKLISLFLIDSNESGE